jgi:hypothetical protein
LFHCPGYNGKIKGQYLPGAIDRLGSYAYNTFGSRIDDRTNENFGLGPVMFWKDATGKYVPAVSEGKVIVPSEMVAIGDSLMKMSEAGGDDVGRCGGVFASDFAALPYVLRHRKNFNQLSCDGHTSAMSPNVLFSPSDSASKWNYDHEPHPEMWKP